MWSSLLIACKKVINLDTETVVDFTNQMELQSTNRLDFYDIYL